MSRKVAIAVTVATFGAAALAACGDDELFAPASDAGVLDERSAPAPIPPSPPSPRDAGNPPVRADFGLDQRPVTTCRAPARPPTSTGGVMLSLVYDNVTATNRSMMAQIPGDKSRWFASQLDGLVYSFAFTNPANTPVIVADLAALSGKVVCRYGEAGFLGLAFHPKFAQNGRLYVSWNSDLASDMKSSVGYLTSADGGATFTSYTDILTFPQRLTPNHKGGGIAFGPDGRLYVSFGDGNQYQGQDTTNFFGKILRVDVDAIPPGKTYGIPADNPFAVSGGEPATYAWGFRNPFRFSFDRGTGDLWVGDVGETVYEEINVVQRGGNYGWDCREGAHPFAFAPPSCPSGKAGTIDPIYEYIHVGSQAIIGGYVYRGAAIPSLVGSYIYGDYVTGLVFALATDPATGELHNTTLNPSGPLVNVTSFVEDADGEIYAVSLDRGMFQLVPTPTDAGAPVAFPDRLSATGCSDPRSLVPYGVNAPLWSDGAAKERSIALPDGATMTVGTDGHFEVPNGSVLVKTFSLAGRKVETRLLVHHDDGVWAGYSYEWLDDQSDAVLLPSSKRKTVGAQSWYFPSRGECLRCHTDAAGKTLGLELGQLDGDFVYASTNRISNQLRTLEHIGMFAAPLPPLADITAFPSPAGTEPIDARARAYLHANCSMCHRPGGPGGTTMDLRFGTSLHDTGTCNAAPQTGDLGVAGAKLLVPGDPARSQLSIRPHALDVKRMPPLATGVVDIAGTSLIDQWITSVTACP